MLIEKYSNLYKEALKEMLQLLHEEIVAFEFWDDDLIVYNTSSDTDSLIDSYVSWENLIFIAIDDFCNPCWCVIGRIQRETSEWSKIEKFWSIEQLVVNTEYRWKWLGKLLLKRIEQSFLFYEQPMYQYQFSPQIKERMNYINISDIKTGLLL